MWLIYAISAAMIWGLNYALDEKIFRSKISPISLLALQMMVGVIIFLVLGFRSQLKQDCLTLLQNRNLLLLTLSGMFVATFGNLLISLSIQAKNATLAGLIELSYPLFTMFFTWILFHENHVNLNTIVGGILIILGVFIISYKS